MFERERVCKGRNALSRRVHTYHHSSEIHPLREGRVEQERESRVEQELDGLTTKL